MGQYGHGSRTDQCTADRQPVATQVMAGGHTLFFISTKGVHLQYCETRSPPHTLEHNKCEANTAS
eukprot:10742442-Lingulodinium_polyedra.AAC.1